MYSVLRLLTEDARCPPTFEPDPFGRTGLAWWAWPPSSHRTRRWTASSGSRANGGADLAVVSGPGSVTGPGGSR